jgi:hypothetical protein
MSKEIWIIAIFCLYNILTESVSVYNSAVQ